jgi:transcription elongation factor Elf1
MDVRGEIETILSSGVFSRAKLALLIREVTTGEAEKKGAPRKKHKSAPAVIQYTSVKKNYTCLHCGSHFSTTIELTKHEDTAVLREDRRVQVINSSSPAEVACVCSSCDACSNFIQKLSREELESRYKWLLSQTSLVGKQMPFGKIITKGDEPEVRW